MSYEAGLKLGRELREASARRAMVELKRLDNGQFAPKGAGQILRKGDHVSVPHKSAEGVQVPGKVTKVKGETAKVELHDGPDAGKAFDVEASGGAGTNFADEDFDSMPQADVPYEKHPNEPDYSREDFDSMPQPPEGMASPGTTGAGTSIKDLPLGTTVTLADGNQYVVHKPVGDPWMILKPVDGGKAKPMHKMAPAVHADTSTAYDAPPTSGDPGNDAEDAAASADIADSMAAESPQQAASMGVPGAAPGYTPSAAAYEKGGGSITDSPGRGPTGKLRNFKAMNKAKLLKTITDLEGHGGDPEALDAANAEAASKGFKAPAASTSPGNALGQAVKKNIAKNNAKSHNVGDVAGWSAAAQLGAKTGGPHKQKPAAKSAPAKTTAGGEGGDDLFGKLAKSVDIAKNAKKQGKDPAKAFKPDGTPSAKPTGTGEDTAKNAALDAYKAAGGTDPQVIEMLKQAAKKTSKA